jgi:hypothetical protein
MIIIPGDNPLSKVQTLISEAIEAIGRFRVLEDANGNDVVDDTGLVSTVNFPNGSVTQSSEITTTSNSFVDMSGVSLTFSLDRTANVLVILDGTGLNDDNVLGSDNCIVTLNVDGSDQSKQMGLPGSLPGDNSGLFGNTGALAYLLSLSSGSHTIKGRFRRNNAGTARVAFASLTYLVLGK